MIAIGDGKEVVAADDMPIEPGDELLKAGNDAIVKGHVVPCLTRY